MLKNERNQRKKYTIKQYDKTSNKNKMHRLSIK